MKHLKDPCRGEVKRDNGVEPLRRDSPRHGPVEAAPFQNRYLRELCGLKYPHRVPGVIGRVENELEFADLILTPSRFVADQLEAIGIGHDKLVVEPFGVDAFAFRPDPLHPQRPPSRCPRGLFVGQISYRKGGGVLLEAARRSRNRRVESSSSGRLSVRTSSMECWTTFAIERRVYRTESHRRCGTPISSCCHRSRMRSVWCRRRYGIGSAAHRQ